MRAPHHTPKKHQIILIIGITLSLSACVRPPASYQYLHNAKVAIDSAEKQCPQPCTALQPAHNAYQQALNHHTQNQHEQARNSAHLALKHAQNVLRQQP